MIFSYGLLRMDTPVLGDQQRLTSIINLEGLPGAMDDRERGREKERVNKLRAISTTWWWWSVFLFRTFKVFSPTLFCEEFIIIWPLWPHCLHWIFRYWLDLTWLSLLVRSREDILLLSHWYKKKQLLIVVTVTKKSTYNLLLA